MAAVHLTEKQFHKLIQEEESFLVDYWAPWCGYCRRIDPAYDKIAEKYQNSLLISKINIDNEPILANQEQIEVIPTLVLYRKGKAVASIVAPESKAKIEEFLQQNFQK